MGRIRLAAAGLAALLSTLTACGGGGENVDATELVALVKRAKIPCPAAWHKADDETLLKLLGSTETHVCASLPDTPFTTGGKDYIVIATFPSESDRDFIAERMAGPDARPGFKTYVGGTWLVHAPDADKMAEVIDGELLS